MRRSEWTGCCGEVENWSRIGVVKAGPPVWAAFLLCLAYIYGGSGSWGTGIRTPTY